MNYLKYIERSAENLQFFLWYRDYCARFGQLPDYEKRLSPEWTKTDAEIIVKPGPRKASVAITELFKDTTFADEKSPITDRVDPFNTPPISPSFDDSSSSIDRTTLGTTIASPEPSSERAFDSAGVKLMPCELYSCESDID